LQIPSRVAAKESLFGKRDSILATLEKYPVEEREDCFAGKLQI
jgi:hypothetical protein